jgi:hypothetical protein
MKRLYDRRFLCSALCQGAAIHAARPEYGYGVKDFDVWSFFQLAPSGQPRGMFLKRATRKPFGTSKFGDDPYKLVSSGRRVDLFWRSIDADLKDPIRSVQNWLAGSSQAAYYLRQKAVVLIDPPQLLGRLIWLFGEEANN